MAGEGPDVTIDAGDVVAVEAVVFVGARNVVVVVWVIIDDAYAPDFVGTNHSMLLRRVRLPLVASLADESAESFLFSSAMWSFGANLLSHGGASFKSGFERHTDNAPLYEFHRKAEPQAAFAAKLEAAKMRRVQCLEIYSASGRADIRARTKHYAKHGSEAYG